MWNLRKKQAIPRKKGEAAGEGEGEKEKKEEEDEEGFACPECGDVLATLAKLAVHRWAKHKVKAEVRRFLPDTICPSCGKEHYTRIRVVQHVTRVPTCYNKVMAEGLPIPQELDDKLEEEAKQHLKKAKRAGLSLYALPL